MSTDLLNWGHGHYRDSSPFFPIRPCPSQNTSPETADHCTFLLHFSSTPPALCSSVNYTQCPDTHPCVSLRPWPKIPDHISHFLVWILTRLLCILHYSLIQINLGHIFCPILFREESKSYSCGHNLGRSTDVMWGSIHHFDIQPDGDYVFKIIIDGSDVLIFKVWPYIIPFHKRFVMQLGTFPWEINKTCLFQNLGLGKPRVIFFLCY